MDKNKLEELISNIGIEDISITQLTYKQELLAREFNNNREAWYIFKDFKRIKDRIQFLDSQESKRDRFAIMQYERYKRNL